MTLFIDPPNAPGHGRMWSHLVSDESFEELHRFARGLGIPERGFDRDHYDIPAERYHTVITAGAVPVSSRELLTRLRRAGLRRRKSEVLGTGRPGRALVRPERLAPGARVAVVAPSGPVPPEQLDAGLAVLRSWGFDVREAEHVRGTDPELGYLAADDKRRADDLTGAWLDNEVAAVVCARGGYGAQRIVDLVDWDALARSRPKVLVGFSDITALHQAFAARLGLATYHGPVVTNLGVADEASRKHLRRTLTDPESATVLTPEPLDVLVPGAAEGVLVGGNLSVLAAGAGARHVMPATGSIAVLEEVGEEPYRLDRLLTQLLRSGWFDGVRGVVVGHLSGCGSEEAVRRVLVDRLGGLGVPLVAGAPFGHETHNLTVPLGVPTTLDATPGASGALRLLSPATR